MKAGNNSLLRKEISITQLVSLIALLYSCVVLSTLAPSIGGIVPTFVLLLYYMIVPGYSVSLLFGENYDALQRLLFSIFISVSLSLSLLGLNHISGSFNIPLELSLPIITIAVVIYEFYVHR